jgi:predicted RNA-binding protein with RPS1 domain
MFMNGSFNPYKKAYMKQLEEQRKASEQAVANYVLEINLLEKENLKLQTKADSIDTALDKEEARRKKERDEFNRKMAELGKLSRDELASYFAERYGNQ